MMSKPHGGNLVNNFINASKIDDDLFILDVDLRIKKRNREYFFWRF